MRSEHLSEIRKVTPSADGCEDCLKIGARWVHFRLCETCGHVGCCDSSPNRHATGHFHASGHPIIKSFEPGEDWGYCGVDQRFYKTLPALGEENKPLFCTDNADKKNKIRVLTSLPAAK